MDKTAEPALPDDTHVWIANELDDTVMELSASTEALVKVISGSAYAFGRPDAIAADGTNVWVANYGGSVRLSGSGGQVRTIAFAPGSPRKPAIAPATREPS